jgi:SAM-dependent methyltransferase
MSAWRNVTQECQAARSHAIRIDSQPCRREAIPASCPDFDRLAGIYRWMEAATFGPMLQRCRCAWLDRLKDARRALVIGDGDGRFTARLLGANSRITVDAVDASRAMLRSLLRCAEIHASRVTLHHADARNWNPGDARYDLVVTHFFLDCLTTDEVRALARSLRGYVEDRGLWVVSEFAVPPNLFGRVVAGPIVATLYRTFGWLTGLSVRSLPDYASTLRDAGFSLEARRAWLGGMLVSEIWRAEPACERH